MMLIPKILFAIACVGMVTAIFIKIYGCYKEDPYYWDCTANAVAGRSMIVAVFAGFAYMICK